jgi:hypothetical protein
MKSLPAWLACALVLLGITPPEAGAQNLPGSLGFSIAGSFLNGSAESINSVLVTDNDLTNGHRAGFDLTDAPSSLIPTGPAGSAAFQWGVAETKSNFSTYLHSSALWFQPLSVANVAPEQSFELGYLYYRNGTIKNKTGADGVDLQLTLTFSQPLGLSPITVLYGSELINSPNSSDPVASADIVSLANTAAPIHFTDSAGKAYQLEVTFAVDQDTIDGSLSSVDQFRVFEGGQGRATLLGRFTTSPGSPVIPEPSATALIGAFGVILLFRRRR